MTIDHADDCSDCSGVIIHKCCDDPFQPPPEGVIPDLRLFDPFGGNDMLIGSGRSQHGRLNTPGGDAPSIPEFHQGPIPESGGDAPSLPGDIPAPPRPRPIPQFGGDAPSLPGPDQGPIDQPGGDPGSLPGDPGTNPDDPGDPGSLPGAPPAIGGFIPPVIT